MNQIMNYKWNKFLNDATEEPQKVKAETALKTFIAKFILSIEKKKLNRQDAMNLIRGIPNVTRVHKEAEGLDSPVYFKALFNIKFVLEPHEDINMYILKVLKRELQKINGIYITAFKGYEEILAKK